MSQLMTSTSPAFSEDSSLLREMKKVQQPLGEGFSLMPSMFGFGSSIEIREFVKLMREGCSRETQ